MLNKNLLKSAMARAGFTQGALASRIGMSENTLSSIFTHLLRPIYGIVFSITHPILFVNPFLGHFQKIFQKTVAKLGKLCYNTFQGGVRYG